MFQKTTIYHSQLVSEGEIEARINSEPCKSKFPAKDGSVQYYVEMIVAGTKHQLILENDSVRQVLCGLKDQTVVLKATGSRDDAQIEVHVVNPGQQQVAPRQQPAPQQSAPQQSAPQQSAPQQSAPQYQAPQQQQQETAPQQAPQQRQHAPTSDINSAKLSIMQITNLHLLCAKAVAQYEVPTLKKATGEDMSESQRQGATASIFIESCKSGLCRLMPSHKIED